MKALLRAMPLLAAFAVALPAQAQVKVSYSALNNLAHDCYISALISVRTGQHQILGDALGACDAALQSPLNLPDRAATFDNRGILHDAAANYPAAWADFDSSIRLNPSLGDAWLNRGAALIRMKKPDQALTDIQHGVTLGPSMPEIGYYDLGVAQQSLGHIPEAYAAYKRAQVANPDFAPATAALKNFEVVPAAATPASSREKSG